MKRYISILLAVLLIVGCLLTGSPQANAAQKATTKRAIAIVFDNSGSMYEKNNKAWCRATYAMEVFASMLNTGDVLEIYPMNPITVDGAQFTMDAPLKITDPSQSSKIREIFTPDGGKTFIKSIDCAAAGLKQQTADEKYLVILTDGGTFTEDNGKGMSKANTKKQLDKRIQALAGPDMNVMYLGIDEEACMPGTAQSGYFTKNKANNSADVLSKLTEMCNQIFGRDILPNNHKNGKTIDFDISMSKLIVFVQGNNISDLKLSGPGGKLVSAQQTKYSTKGAGDYKNSAVDESLQGMIVTYTDCPAGTYNIEFKGTDTSTEIYYEPDTDLDFVFTDAAGNTVDPQALYEGEYKVAFGLKDAKTGQLIESDLLGAPEYTGNYIINGKSTSFSKKGFSGSEKIPLKMGDKFAADLTVTYLSGYTISKDSSDFGWPEGGIQVAARPAGDFSLEISGGDDIYSLQNLEEGSPYIAKIYYQGTQLTGDELKKVELKWEPETSNAEIKKDFAEDHWNLTLHYKDPNEPKNTVCGKCTVTIHAFYSAQGSSQAQTSAPLAYEIEADIAALSVQMIAQEDYIVISEMTQGKLITAKVTLNGAELTAEQFAALSEPVVQAGGINYTVTPDPENSAYQILLEETPDIKEGNYAVKLATTYTDEIGVVEKAEGVQGLTLSEMPMWLKWLIFIGALILLIILIWIITHIPALPIGVVTAKANCTLTVGAVVVDGPTVTYPSKRDGSTVNILTKKEIQKFGLKFSGITPGPNSYIVTPQKNRSFVVKVENISAITGGTTIKSATIGGVAFTTNPTTHKLECEQQGIKQITLRNNSWVSYEGVMFDNGKNKTFNADLQIEFKKK